MLKRINVYILLLFGLFLNFLCAQELPPINNYLPIQYGAETQNWSITQAEDKSIYVANNSGVLEFNGARWKLYHSPNETIVRSVHAIGNRIYSGSYMEFGYWEKNVYGELDYFSLSQQISYDIIEDEQFWGILGIDNWIIFQSLNRIHIYNTSDGTFNNIEAQTTITKMMKVDDRIFFHRAELGLFEISNGNDVLVSNHFVAKNNIVINIFKQDDDLLVQTQNDGLYLMASDGSLKRWPSPSADALANLSVYNSIKLNNGSLALGTISNGIVVVDKNGTIDYQINKDNGLNNNTVLSLFEDMDNNIWLGLDNGIDSINLNSPIRTYNGQNDQLGTIYASALVGDTLYLGTNQGLYSRSMVNGNHFEFIEGTQGQVWCLVNINEQLFCGHNSGTFVVEGNRAIRISDVQGTWDIKTVDNNSNLLIQGNYNGLNVLERNDGIWTFRNKLEGFNNSSRHFDFAKEDEIFVGHEYKGLFKLKINSDFTEVLSIDKDAFYKGTNSNLIKYGDHIFYAYNNGIFKYNEAQDKFVKDSLLSSAFDDGYISGKLIYTPKTDKLWAFSKESISYIQPQRLSSDLEVNKIPISNAIRNTVTDYESILNIEDEKYLFGTSFGYFIIDLDNIDYQSYKVQLNSIKSTNIKEEELLLDKTQFAQLDNTFNNIEFNYYVTEYDKYLETEYQYQLVGMYDNWSPWSSTPSHSFNNLPFGSYTFNVRARVGNNIAENTASYTFQIDRPWYMSNLAIMVYVISVLLFSLMMHGIYKRYYKKQQKKIIAQNQRELDLKELENKQQLMRFKNESLELDIQSKNRELAVSTMSLIKKNEFLSKIKQELMNIKDNQQLKPVIGIIDRNLNNTNDWKMFEEAFNNADKDFLKKIKEKHKALTPNDLRLCAYLRLNLSSKEIAPLLNISARSVEVKRYRLRKKMNLPHESSLTNYILEI